MLSLYTDNYNLISLLIYVLTGTIPGIHNLDITTRTLIVMTYQNTRILFIANF